MRLTKSIFLFISVLSFSTLLGGEVIQGIIKPARELTLSFARAEQVVDLLEEGRAFKEGETIARQDDRGARMEMLEAKMGMEMANVALETAEHELAKKERLLQQNIVAPIALKEAKFGYRQADAKLRAAVARFQRAQLLLQEMQLVAPFSGVVKQTLVSEGEQTNAGQPVLQILDLSRLEITVDLPLADTESLQVGQRAQITVESEVVGEAELTQLFPFLDPASGMRRVVWRVLNPKDILPGRYVTLTL